MEQNVEDPKEGTENVKHIPTEADSAEAEYPASGNDDEEAGDGEEVGREGDVVETKETQFYDKDEEIIAAMFSKGITRVSSQELLDAGIDADRIRPTSFSIGRYTISRVVLISKYTIEKIV